MHSHLLPGLDDGAETLEDSMELIREFVNLGFKKLITTPHIMGDFYKNTPEGIHEKLNLVREQIKKENLDISLDAAAEYYLDEWFIKKLDKPENLLSFGNKYLLFETSYINEPVHLDEAIFQIKSSGFQPVLAHPERYTYLYSDFKKFIALFEKGIYFQLNLNSLSGYYSKTAQIYAQKLVDNNMVNFVGTDCHGIRHMHAFKKTISNKYYNKLLDLPLLNNELL
ncbi:MAG: tyrosine-protein phosphatase [Cytophagaceae bacterium]